MGALARGLHSWEGTRRRPGHMYRPLGRLCGVCQSLGIFCGVGRIFLEAVTQAGSFASLVGVLRRRFGGVDGTRQAEVLALPPVKFFPQQTAIRLSLHLSTDAQQPLRPHRVW